LRVFFSLLYHQFAWAYDWVADVVSLGMWKGWIFTILPSLASSNVLELGPGSGHLMLAMRDKFDQAFGIEASPEMARIAARRLKKKGHNPKLVIGESQHLPYGNESFQQIVTTFPSEYIKEGSTHEEIWRVLQNPGELLILPAAWINGESLIERFAAWLFRVTAQTPGDFGEDVGARITEQLMDESQSSFQIQSEIIDLESSKVLLIHAKKVSQSESRSTPS
jgi:ubiquinone/menaquinone biosynthesis C-methylase UbiE